MNKLAAKKKRSSPAAKGAKLKSRSVSPLWQGFVWGSCFTVTALLSSILGMTIALKTPLPVSLELIGEKLEKLKTFTPYSWLAPPLTKPINILVMGIDRVPNATGEGKFSGRSDTLLLVRLNPETNSIVVLSIPRDSRVRMPDGHYDKINSANPLGGIPWVKKVIEENFKNVTVDHYVRVSTEALRKLVDAVGGVEVYVPKDMQYVDRTQGLYIDLKEGKQVLDGEKAEQFIRFRNDWLADIGRIQRQQLLLQALEAKLRSPQTLLRLPSIIQTLQEEVDTDLSKSQLWSIVNFALGVDRDNIRMILLPGKVSSSHRYNTSYWLISEPDLQKIISEHFNGNTEGREESPSPDSISIVIQNSTPNPELARRLAEILREKGYTHVRLGGKSPFPTDTTLIIVQKGDESAARQVQKLLPFGSLEFSSTGDVESDITIRLGMDAEKLLEEKSFAQ
ncbi:MAG: LCP family protein [Geminocystis sp.]|nr:LCP family protein [Geminocystis sp.]MCX8077557.1 LCP family protein [Geminocystis sp.]